MQLFYKVPLGSHNHPLYLTAARWLVRHNRPEFESRDIIPFIEFIQTRKTAKIDDEGLPKKSTDAVRWCQKHLIGMRAAWTSHNPFLSN
jgi:hypothetical protein